MGSTLLEQTAAGEAPPAVSFTVQQYHAMIENGILREGDPVELIDGVLIRKDRSTLGTNQMTHDPRHALVIKRLLRLDRRLEPYDCHLQSQLPVTLSEVSEPEPDAAVVKGTPEAFADHHPGPRDLVAVLEVADSSLQFDRTTKQGKYAIAGIGQYWILNLVEDQIELYESPISSEGRYAQRVDYQLGQVVPLKINAATTIQVPVADLLSK